MDPKAFYGTGYPDKLMDEAETRSIMKDALDAIKPEGKKIIIIIPDGTRTTPIGMFFRLFHELLSEKVEQLDYLLALGTHQPMDDRAIRKRIEVSEEEMNGRFSDVNIYNHHWDDPDTFTTVGTISSEEIDDLSEGRLSMEVPVKLNKKIFDYDMVFICGPVFPHEVVGFSGGNKYFFPGISGQEVIDFTHWLGALMTSREIIGTKHTPVRAVIDKAASYINMPKYCFAHVATKDGLAGLFVGTPETAWEQAAELSSGVHIVYVKKPYKRVLSIIPEMYDDIWTGAKGMYKMDPVIADGGEVIIYAPHISEFSYTHGETLEEIGYHVRDYFVKQWDNFKEYPWGNLAHSTHLKGTGTYDPGTDTEEPRIRVTLATQISEERCKAANLGYRDPDTIDVRDFENREDEGTLVVHKAGEMLYRLKE